LFFARPLPKLPSPLLFSIIGIRKRCQDVRTKRKNPPKKYFFKKMFPSFIIAILHTTGLLSFPQSEIRAGKLLVDPGHLQGDE
jgi:hypothetical protein